MYEVMIVNEVYKGDSNSEEGAKQGNLEDRHNGYMLREASDLNALDLKSEEDTEKKSRPV